MKRLASLSFLCFGGVVPVTFAGSSPVQSQRPLGGPVTALPAWLLFLQDPAQLVTGLAKDMLIVIVPDRAPDP